MGQGEVDRPGGGLLQSGGRKPCATPAASALRLTKKTFAQPAKT